MTKVNLTRTEWTQINSAAKRIQIFGGRILVAESDSPAADDWQVWPEGEVVDVTANKFAKALDKTDTWVIAQDV